jgi:ADP-heptose:LPS heptosyltransferase
MLPASSVAITRVDEPPQSKPTKTLIPIPEFTYFRPGEGNTEPNADGYLMWVIRYQCQDIPDRGLIAVVSNDAIGNYVVITPLLELIRQKYPRAHITYISGTRTQELWDRDDRIDAGVAMFGREPAHLWSNLAMVPNGENFDWVINVEQAPMARVATALLAGATGYVTGPCVDSEGRGDLAYPDDEVGDLARDRAWIAEDITERYPVLNSGFIGEIFCRLCYFDRQVPKYRVPTVDTESPVDVLIAMSASLPEKLWPLQHWETLVKSLRQTGLSVGLLGAKPSVQAGYWKGSGDEQTLVDSGLVKDLRGHFTLPQVVGALSSAKLVVTLDNGIMHLAAATETKTVALFRPGIHRLWTPPKPNIIPIIPGTDLVADISVDSVLGATIEN